MKSFVPAAALVAVTAFSTIAAAQAIDPAESPYLDVIETTSGSTWRGVLVEQIPGKSYKIVLAGGSVVVVQAAEVVKITKERNPQWHDGPRGSAVSTAMPVHEGLRIGAATGFAFLLGDDNSDALFDVAFHAGWELEWQGLSLTPGARVALIRIPAYETFYVKDLSAEVQVARRTSRVIPHGELGLCYDSLDDASGFAIHMGAGVDLALSPAISLTSELAYHRTFGFQDYQVPDGIGADAAFLEVLVGITWAR